MKKKEKRRTIRLIIVVVIILTILVAIKNSQKSQENQNSTEEYVKILEDGTQQNISKKLNENKEIEGIQISNIQLTEHLGETILLTEVKNLTELETESIGITIILLDQWKCRNNHYHKK